MTDRPSIDAFSTAKDRAFALTEAHTPELAHQYATVIRKAGRRAARRFKTSARLVSLQAAGHVREEEGLELTAASETPSWAVPPVDELLDVVQVTQDLLGATEQTRQAAAVSAVRPITSVMGVSFELEAPLVKDLVSKAGVRAAKISIPGLRDAVYFAIKQAFEEGLSVDQTASLILEKTDNLAGYQSEMLARTDLIGTANGGSLLAAKTVWPQGGITKRWVNATDSNTVNDGRIRPTHLEANGQEVPIDGHFIVGGARMLYPGDPSGPDEECINCRCTMSYSDALQASANPDVSDKAMVAVYPREDEQKALALDDGADPETLHVTVVYLGEAADVDLEAVAQTLADIARVYKPLKGKVSGVGRFAAGDDGVPVFAIPSVQGLAELHSAVSDALEQQGIESPTEHGFNPHITLTYADEDGLELPDVPDVPLHFDAITLAQGDVRRDFPLTGDMQAAAWDESKHPREPGGRREGGRFARAAGPVMGVKRLGVTSVNGVFVGELEGEKVIVKPQAGLTPDRLREHVDPGRDLEREQAAAIVSQMLEEEAPDVAIPVPDNRIMEAAGYGRSGVSEFVTGETVAVLGMSQPHRVGKGIAPAIRNIRLYDGIIGNTDRHDGNMVLDHADTLHAIDHGLAFPSRNQAKWPAIQGAYMETELSGSEREALERVRPRIQSDPELAKLLTAEEIAATDQRIGYMLERGRLLTVDDWQAGVGALEEAA